MATPVIMPKQGQSVESCIITQWFKKKGEQVKIGELLFAYETDKAAFEEEAPVDGIILEVFYKEGDEVEVLKNVAVIGKENESIEEFLNDADSRERKESPAQESEEKTHAVSTGVSDQKPVTADSAPATNQSQKFISPRARKLAGEKGVAITDIQGTGPSGRIIERDILAYMEKRPKISPLAKRAMEAEEKISAETGSGLAGTINYDDLKAKVNEVYAGDFDDKPLSNTRKIIAKSMYASLQNTAQLTHHLSADARKLLELRSKVKAKQKEGFEYNITLNDMVCYAVVRALKKHSEVNAHFLGDSIRTFKKVHLGLAVDTERGLMVPVVRNADDLSLFGLSSQLRAVAENCKTGKINPDLLASTAASFTVSNLGNYGVEMFTPIINVPQVGILGVNTIIQRPAQLENGAFGFVPYMGLSLTYDHRAVDGGPATIFLAAIRDEIENFDTTIL